MVFVPLSLVLLLALGGVSGSSTWQLKHSFPSADDSAAAAAATAGQLQSRGSIELLDESLGDGDDQVSVSQKRVSKAQWTSLVAACRASIDSGKADSGDSLYRVDMGPLGAWSMRACDLVQSRLKDEIMMTLVDGKPLYASGRAVLTVAQHAQLQSQSHSSIDESFPRKGVWDTSVIFRLPSKGASPLVEDAVAPRERTPQQKVAEEQEQQGFLQKYWYVLLPAVIYMFTQNMAPPPPASPGANAAGGGGNQPRAGGPRR
jgi:hypothetical protein